MDLVIPLKDFILKGILEKPAHSKGLVVFVHGSGSSRFSSRNQFVAKYFNQIGFATLLVDLLTSEEEKADEITRKYRFNIALLAERLILVTKKIREIEPLEIAYFGASTGAAAALIAAVKDEKIFAVISRGGRPDLAEDIVKKVKAPTILIVGEKDQEVIKLNEKVYGLLRCKKKMTIIAHATHLFEEPGCLEQVAKYAGEWLMENLLDGASTTI